LCDFPDFSASFLNAIRVTTYIARKHMSSPSTTKPAEPLSDGQKAALVNLLGDDDAAVYQTVRENILSYGQEATQWLRPHTLSSDAVLRRRAQEIVQYLARQSADNHFLAFCLSQGEDLDIEEAAWLLAQTQYPEINLTAYQALFDSYASDLRERIDLSAGAEALLGAVNQYLFGELKFHGNEQNYYEPDNSYLNRVLDRRTGNPITLCLVYLLIARRLRLPIAGIGMPGHFLVRYQSSTAEIYIDAFNQGKLLTKADCVKYLLHTSHGFQESYLSVITSRRMLLRMCSNLHQIYVQLELTEETARVQRYIVALAK
jgi:regulator of sirC expression with transglutaminase-like and TPR domain